MRSESVVSSGLGRILVGLALLYLISFGVVLLLGGSTLLAAGLALIVPYVALGGLAVLGVLRRTTRPRRSTRA